MLKSITSIFTYSKTCQIHSLYGAVSENIVVKKIKIVIRMALSFTVSIQLAS